MSASVRDENDNVCGVHSPLHGKHVTLCVTGSIAAYKAVLLARACLQAGAVVQPVMTEAAKEFVGPTTFSGICGLPVLQDMWDPTQQGEAHVEVGGRTDIVAVVPATADVLSRIAHGRANDMVAAITLCTRAPIVLAPAMHPRMWENPATLRNVALLRDDPRVSFAGPTSGLVASGDEGFGRMVEPEEILAMLEARVTPQDLAGTSVLIAAGPTQEPIDPVRYLGNRSSGKMGFALAKNAAQRGAKVRLVAGPVQLPTPPGVERIDVTTAEEMRTAVLTHARESRVVVMAAAVADFRAKDVSSAKIKKVAGTAPTLTLVQNADILAELGTLYGPSTGKAGPFLVGFALETGTDAEVIAYAKEKLTRKNVGLIVANAASESLGKDTNRIHLVADNVTESLAPDDKNGVAKAIWDRVRVRL